MGTQESGKDKRKFFSSQNRDYAKGLPVLLVPVLFRIIKLVIGSKQTSLLRI